MARTKLYPPKNMVVDFKPSPKQYELWKQLQAECPKCGGNIEIEDIGGGNTEAICQKCGNDNIPQQILAGKRGLLVCSSARTFQ